MTKVTLHIPRFEDVYLITVRSKKVKADECLQTFGPSIVDGWIICAVEVNEFTKRHPNDTMKQVWGECRFTDIMDHKYQSNREYYNSQISKYCIDPDTPLPALEKQEVTHDNIGKIQVQLPKRIKLNNGREYNGTLDLVRIDAMGFSYGITPDNNKRKRYWHHSSTFEF